MTVDVSLLICHDSERLHVLPAGPGRFEVGCVVWLWSGVEVRWEMVPAQFSVTSQTRWSGEVSTHQVTGCQEHNSHLPVNWCVMKFFISPHIMSGTSKLKFHWAAPLLYFDNWLTGSILSWKWLAGWKTAHYYSIIWSFGCLRENLSKLGRL